MSPKFRFILLILSAVLSSCAGSAEMRADGSVKFTGPVMARVDRFAVAVKKPDGTTVKIYMVNGNSEAVPMAVAQAAGTGYSIGKMTQGLINRQDNNAATSQLLNNNATKTTIIESNNKLALDLATLDAANKAAVIVPK